jgi:hypothetical protein
MLVTYHKNFITTSCFPALKCLEFVSYLCDVAGTGVATSVK